MGAGKTTAGKSLAKKMNYDFYDLDHYIESRYLKTVSQIFNEYGEDRFREIEKNMLEEVGHFENVIIATGGGTPCFYDNMEYMNKNGLTIFLYASPNALLKRLVNCKSQRPLIAGKSEKELLAYIVENLNIRLPFYKEAQVTFETEYIISKELMDEYVDKLITNLNLDRTGKES